MLLHVDDVFGVIVLAALLGGDVGDSGGVAPGVDRDGDWGCDGDTASGNRTFGPAGLVYLAGVPERNRRVQQCSDRQSAEVAPAIVRDGGVAAAGKLGAVVLY